MKGHCLRFLLCFLGMGYLPGCSDSAPDPIVRASITPPTEQGALYDFAGLGVEVKLNGGASRLFSRPEAGSWTVDLAGVNLDENNTLDIAWIIAIEGHESSPFTIATATETFYADSSTGVTNLAPSYADADYDHDNDSLSNLSEVNLNTFPIMVPQMVTLFNPGTYTMGSPETEKGGCAGTFHCPNEQQKTVSLETFAISKYEVTFKEYLEFVNNTIYSKPFDQGWGQSIRPVINVSWDEATAYARWLSEQTGKKFRLPTEAEWEYAARANSTTPYNTGDTLLPSQANFNTSLPPYSDSSFEGKTVPVNRHAANDFGISGMHGNVFEWTCSPYQPTYAGEETDCTTDAQGRLMMIRGGAWNFPMLDNRSANRGWIDKAADGTVNFGSNYIGIRLAMDP